MSQSRIQVGDLALRHYAAEPVKAVRSVEQVDHPAMKPRGFWVSDDACDDNWRAWCEGETFALDRLAVAHDVHLRPDARVLRLRGSVDLLEFSHEYLVHRAPLVHGFLVRSTSIDWPRVARQWQGIVISPYVWHLRLADRVSWYYSWDCASGCIWDANAIERITVDPLTEPTAIPTTEGIEA